MKHVISIFTTVALFTLILCGCGPSKTELNIYCYGGILKQEIIEKFEKENNCRVVFNFYESNEALYAKLKAGASGYDLYLPTSYFVNTLASQDLIEKIDTSKLPNLKNLDTDFLEKIKAPKSEYCVPFASGCSIIGYNTDKVSEQPDSWAIFGSDHYKGRLTMLNDRREIIGSALLYLGYSANSKNPAEIDKAVDVAINWKNHLAKFEGEQYKNGLNSGEYLVAQGWSLDLQQIREENPSIGITYPKEGFQIFLDTFAIAKNAPSRELAYKFINFIFDPQVAAENIEYIRYYLVNKEAVNYLSDETKHNAGIMIPAEIIHKGELTEDIGEAITLYNNAWNKILEN